MPRKGTLLCGSHCPGVEAAVDVEVAVDVEAAVAVEAAVDVEVAVDIAAFECEIKPKPFWFRYWSWKVVTDGSNIRTRNLLRQISICIRSGLAGAC
jgi:hypothetical protein